MKHLIKTDTEIIRLRESCKMLSQVLSTIIDQLEPGLTTGEIDNLARKEIKALGGKPAFYGYQGFPGAACVSINDQVVHGIPGQYEIIDGDIVSVDCGVEYKGMISDSAFSQIVGRVDPDDQALLDTTLKSLNAGISKVKAGAFTGDIGQAVQEVLELNGYGVVRDLVGHGVGRSLHEPPEVPNFGKAGTGKQLLAGMTIAIEPMASRGDWKISTLSDNWTVVTRDGSRSAHFEHTILVTEAGSEVLTARTVN